MKCPFNIVEFSLSSKSKNYELQALDLGVPFLYKKLCHRLVTIVVGYTPRLSRYRMDERGGGIRSTIRGSEASTHFCLPPSFMEGS